MQKHIENIYNNIYKIQDNYKKNIAKTKHNINILKTGDNMTKNIWNIMDKYAQITKYEKKEVNNPKGEKIYKILVADTKLKLKLFCIYSVIFGYRSALRSLYFNNEHKKTHIGIDFEFNDQVIALMQLNFEDIKKCYIWILNPDEFDTKQNDIFLDNIMINKHIYKILHGPESLDIPYMYNTLFNNNRKDILAFTSRVIDTRYLCEYYKVSLDQLDKKCTIYSALYYFNTIDKKKLNYLEDIHEKMGNISNISWNVHNLNKYYLEYALYDVLFLQHFLFNIYENITVNTPIYLNTYKYISNIIRFVFCERRGVTNISNNAKIISDKFNNYIVKDISIGNKSYNMTLIKIYNSLIKNFMICNNNIDIDFILSIGYFKRTLIPILKQIVYNVIHNNYDVYKDNKYISKNKLLLHETFKNLRKYNYKTIHQLLHLFENEISIKITTLYR